MIRLSIRRKIMGIAVVLIVLMTITAILSMVWVIEVGYRLQELAGILFSGGWIAFATITLFLDRAKHGPGPRVTMG